MPGGERRRRAVPTSAPTAQHVAGAQRPALVAAEPAEGERRAAAEVRRGVEPAAHRERGAQPGPVDGADVERPRPAATATGFHGGDGDAVDASPASARRRRRTTVAGGEAQRPARRRSLERRGALGVADDPVAEPVRQVVHRPARRHTDVPVADAAGQVLHRGERPAVEHLDGRGRADVGRRSTGSRPDR